MAAKSKLELLLELSDKLFNSKLNSVTQKLDGAVNKMQGKLTRFKNFALTEFSKSGSAIGGWLQDAFREIPFSNLLSNPLVLAGAAAGNALRLGIQQDFNKTSFRVLLNSESAAKKMMEDITKYGMETPYDKAGLAENTKLMLSFGIDTQKIMPTLEMIGDIAMGDANKMNSLTLAFSQMSSTGKLMGQDLLQMINAGFNPLEEISKKTGRSIGDLKKDMEAGLITTQMVEDAFRSATSEGGRFNGMAEQMGKELGGKWAQTMDNVNEKFLELYEIIKPTAIAFLDIANVVIDKVFAGFKWWFQELRDGNPLVGILSAIIVTLTAAFVTYELVIGAVTLATKAWAVAQGILDALMLANPIGLVIVAIVVLIAWIGIAIYKYDQFGAAMMAMMGPIGILINGMESLRAHWDSIEKAFQTEGISGALKRIFVVLHDAILKPLQQILEIAAKLPGSIGEFASDASQKIEQVRNHMGLITEKERAANQPNEFGFNPMGTFNWANEMLNLYKTKAPAPPVAPGPGVKKAGNDLNSIAGKSNQVRHMNIRFEAFNKGDINVTNGPGGKSGMSPEDLEKWFMEMMMRVIANAENG